MPKIAEQEGEKDVTCGPQATEFRVRRLSSLFAVNFCKLQGWLNETLIRSWRFVRQAHYYTTRCALFAVILIS